MQSKGYESDNSKVSGVHVSNCICDVVHFLRYVKRPWNKIVHCELIHNAFQNQSEEQCTATHVNGIIGKVRVIDPLRIVEEVRDRS